MTQTANNVSQRSQSILNHSNGYIDQTNRRVEITTVRQVHDQTYFKRGTNWVDARLLKQAAQPKPDQVVEFGTPEFVKLLEHLISEGRQGALAHTGDVPLSVNGKTILVKMPTVEDKP